MTASFRTGVLLTLGDGRFQFIIVACSSTTTVKGLSLFLLHALLFQKTFRFLWFSLLWAILWHMTPLPGGILLFFKQNLIKIALVVGFLGFFFCKQDQRKKYHFAQFLCCFQLEKIMNIFLSKINTLSIMTLCKHLGTEKKHKQNKLGSTIFHIVSNRKKRERRSISQLFIFFLNESACTGRVHIQLCVFVQSSLWYLCNA